MEYTPDFDLGDVVNAIRDLANARPRYVYRRPLRTAHDSFYNKPVNVEDGCMYVHLTKAGKPRPGTGCIVGRALQKLGVPSEWFIETDTNVGTNAYNVLDRLMGRETARVEDRRRRRWIASVQGEQDRREPWGHCVAKADMEIAYEAMGL